MFLLGFVVVASVIGVQVGCMTALEVFQFLILKPTRGERSQSYALDRAATGTGN